MTYDNTDSDADSVVDADVDNQSVNAEQTDIKNDESGLGSGEPPGQLYLQRQGTHGQNSGLRIQDDGGRIADGNGDIVSRINRVDGTVSISRNEVWDGSKYVREIAGSQTASRLEVGKEGLSHNVFLDDGSGRRVVMRTTADTNPPKVVVGNDYSGNGGDAHFHVGSEEGENFIASTHAQFLSDSGEEVAILDYQDGSIFGGLRIGKSRSGTAGSSGTAVQDGDRVGQIAWMADDGTDMQNFVAQIRTNIDGPPGADDVPGRLSILTTADGARTSTEALRVDSAQHLDFRANATETTDGMNKNPESESEDAFITVKLNGTTYEIPAYATA
jgi:hypothetical protein